jgi:hypothetical protein
MSLDSRSKISRAACRASSLANARSASSVCASLSTFASGGRGGVSRVGGHAPDCRRPRMITPASTHSEKLLMNDSRLAAVEACWPVSVLRTERQAAPKMHAHEGGESGAEPERTAPLAMLYRVHGPGCRAAARTKADERRASDDHARVERPVAPRRNLETRKSPAAPTTWGCRSVVLRFPQQVRWARLVPVSASSVAAACQMAKGRSCYWLLRATA